MEIPARFGLQTRPATGTTTCGTKDVYKRQHRDYSVHTENVPIRIEMYRDRMEIANSGGLYGKITVDSLGKVRPETRNAALANMLELLKVTENRYSGIPTIRRACKDAGLPAPIFSVLHGEFKVVFLSLIHI